MAAERRHQGLVIMVDPPRLNAAEVAMRSDPCLLGQHRAAWLVSGGMACGRCGVPL